MLIYSILLSVNVSSECLLMLKYTNFKIENTVYMYKNTINQD